MLRLLLALSLRTWRRRCGRSLLALVAVALGVALYLAAAVANASLSASFESAVETLARNIDLHVGSGIGVDEDWLARVEAVPGVQAVAPVLQSPATLLAVSGQPPTEGATVLVLGIDARRDPRVREYGDAVTLTNALALATDTEAVLVTEAFRERFFGRPLRASDTVRLQAARVRDFPIAGTVTLTGAAKVVGRQLVLMPLRVAQRAFARIAPDGRPILDRLDVVCAPDADPDEVRARIVAALPANASVWTPDEDVSDFRRSVSSFQAVLVVIALLSLLVAIAFIGNTITLQVVERTREIGVLRALGATSATVRNLFLGEALIYGVLGTGLGIVLGLGIAHAMLGFLRQSVSVLYFTWQPDALALTPGMFVTAATLGILSCVLAAWLPAARAAKMVPMRVLAATDYRSTHRGRFLKSFALGAALFGGSFVFYVWPWLWPQQAGFAMTLLLALGIALMAPHVTLTVLRALHALLCRRAPFTLRLALDHLLKYPTRTAMTLVMTGLSLALILGIAVVSSSLKETLGRWLQRVIPGDIVLSTSEQLTNAQSFQSAAPELLQQLAAVRGVQEVMPLRFVTVAFRERTVLLGALDFAAYTRHVELPVVRGERQPAVDALIQGTGVVVSENFALHFGVAPGETIALPALAGMQPYRVAAVIEDYSWPSGIVYVDWYEFQKRFGDARVDLVELVIEPGHSAEDVAERVRQSVAAEHHLFVATKAAYIGGVLGFIDQMYAMTYFQSGIAVIVGVFSIFVAVTLTVLLRRREIGLLRAVGMTRAQITALVVWEALILAVASGIFGVLAGITAYIPSRLILLTESGYVFGLHVPLLATAGIFVLALVIGLAACVLPVRRANRLSIPEAVGYE